jgi:hypothetical protein
MKPIYNRAPVERTVRPIMMIKDGRPVMFINKGDWYHFTFGWPTLWFMESVFNVLKLPHQYYWFDAYAQFIEAMKMPGFADAVDAIENDMLFGAF